MSAETALPHIDEQSADRHQPGAIAASRGVTAELVAPGEWDRLVGEMDGVCQEQLVAFSAVRWPNMEIDALRFTRAGSVIGGCLIMHKSLPFRLGGFAVVKWGPVLADQNSADAPANYAAMVDILKQRYAAEKGLMLSILPRAMPVEDNYAHAALAEQQFRPGPQLPYPNRYFVRIGLSSEETMKSYAQKWRYHLRKSEKEEMTFELCGSDALYVFNALYEEMSARKQFPDYSAFTSLPDLMKADPGVRPEVFMVRKQGRAVAGAVIFTAGETAVYLYGATSDDALPLRAGYFMHGRIIEWLSRNPRIKWYDLGGTDGFDGLHQFKAGMVGKAGMITQVPPVMHYAHHWWPRLFGTTIYGIRDLRARIKRVLDRKAPRG
ncbi:lipid II:glycine glycyltransferase FemX [Cucumibacter marinus]|uniref:lipid II:glycine glycyltransferase FemX n=1 Tax=Cucumibacter marinus TaxID=1121252 RepID=UPI000420E06B|nr:GNAT family N-acetyltransferase [Cucumibacter marinus]